MPGGVPSATVAEAVGVSDEDLAWTERVAIRTPGWRVGDPLAVRGLNKVALTHIEAAKVDEVLGPRDDLEEGAHGTGHGSHLGVIVVPPGSCLVRFWSRDSRTTCASLAACVSKSAWSSSSPSFLK